MANEPIIEDRDSQLRSFARKWQRPTDPTFARAQQAASPQALRSLQRVDAQRLARGQRIYAQPESAVMLQAGTTGESAIGEPETGFVGDLQRNIREFIPALTQLPWTVAREAQQIPNVGEEIAEGLQEANTPLEALGNVAATPVVRFAPGAFWAEQFRTGGPGLEGITENPLFAALDVLPYASKAARIFPGNVPTAGRSAIVSRFADEVDQGVTPMLRTNPTQRIGAFGPNVRYWRPGGPTPRTSPLPVDRGVRSAGPGQGPATLADVFEPNPIGRILETAGSAVRGNRVGNLVDQAFGRRARSVAELKSRAARPLNDPSYRLDVDEPLHRVRDKNVEEGLELEAQIDAANPGRVAELRNRMQRGEPGWDQGLSTLERQWLDRYMEGQRILEDDVVRQYAADPSTGMARVSFRTPDGNTVTELVSPRIARSIENARKVERQASAVDKASRALNDRNVSISGDDLRTLGELPGNEGRWAARAIVTELDARGFDIGDARRQIHSAKNKAELTAAVNTIADRVDAGLGMRAVPTIDDVLAEMTWLARSGDTMAARALDLMRSGSWADASKRVRQMARRKNPPVLRGLTFDDIIERVAAENRRSVFQQSAAIRQTDQALKNARRKLVAVEQRARPARYSELVADRMSDELRAALPRLTQEGKITPPEAAAAAAQLADGLLDEAPLPKALLAEKAKLRREIYDGWMNLVDEGYNPVFVHRAPSGLVARARGRGGKVPLEPTGRLTKVTQVKDRVNNWGSSTTSPMVALDQQAAELLIRRGNERLLETVADMHGMSTDAVYRLYEPYARQAAQRDPSFTTVDHLKRLRDRDWVELTVPGRDKVWIPRTVSQTLDKLVPKDLGPLSLAGQKVMNAFRTAVLPFAPRFHVYNITGGAMFAMMTDPSSIRFLPEAYRISRGLDPDAAARLRNLDGLQQIQLKTMADRMKDPSYQQMQQWGLNNQAGTKAGNAEAAWRMSMGAKARQLWDRSGESVPQKVKDGLVTRKEWLEARSYAWNEMNDDMFRVMVALSADAKKLNPAATGRVNLSDDAARALSDSQMVDAARSVMQNWDRLTPMERTVLRGVFPFYSFASFLIGHSLRLPFDHPWRIAVMTNIAGTEIDDFQTGLPQAFMSMIDLPDWTRPVAQFAGAIPGIDVPDDPDAKMYLNIQGFNPYRDISSYAGLLGFFAGNQSEALSTAGAITGQANPVLQLAMTAVGLDPTTGLADPYANVDYDPITGGLVTRSDFTPFAVPQAIIPQTRVFFDLMGVNRDFQQMLRSNPDAARRRLISTLGIPAAVTPQQRNETIEIMKAEQRRYEDVSRTRSEALRTGNVSRLDRYPEILAADRQALEQLQAQGRLEDVQPLDEDEILERLVAPPAGRRSALAP
ncbi:MAG: hypothetical protein ACF8PN_08080 [Phycisphaerales bacterium]